MELLHRFKPCALTFATLVLMCGNS
ncbi:hypothetical protein, partial [Acinetobacter pittii]